MPADLVFQHQQKMMDECPKCDICGKDRFKVSCEYVNANHRTIASKAIYVLCEGPDVCLFHCTCHIEVPAKFGVTQVLHVL